LRVCASCTILNILHRPFFACQRWWKGKPNNRRTAHTFERAVLSVSHLHFLLYQLLQKDFSSLFSDRHWIRTHDCERKSLGRQKARSDGLFLKKQFRCSERTNVLVRIQEENPRNTSAIPRIAEIVFDTLRTDQISF
jgi:hypothetical protein